MLKCNVFDDYGKPVLRTGMTREEATLDDRKRRLLRFLSFQRVTLIFLEYQVGECKILC
ncbi:MAG: hypothetical protein ACR5K9_01990 [Wolbachia sp.]